MKVSVDRINGGIAILIPRDNPDRQIRLPAAFLPDGCREGDVLDFVLEPDPAGTTAARERVASLVEKLKKNG